MKRFLLATVFSCVAGGAFAACPTPNGTVLNPYHVKTGVTCGTVAAGDALATTATAAAAAQATATAAGTAAATAQTDATAAGTAASEAQTTANAAGTAAAAAQNTATDAQTSATAAGVAAGNAQTTATAAGTAAATAQTAAENAQTTATAAGTAAAAAQTTASAAIPTSTLNEPNGPAQLDANGAITKYISTTAGTARDAAAAIAAESAAQSLAAAALPKSGGVMTGSISSAAGTISYPTASFSGSMTEGTTSQVVLVGSLATINGPAATNRLLRFNTAGSDRWALLGSSTAESGSNLGTNLQINSYDDTGALIGTPFSIARATGVVTMDGGMIVGAVGVGLLSNAQSTGPDSLMKASGGGTQPYQAAEQYRSAIHQFQSYDGSEQMRVAFQPGASEFWMPMGGLTTDGATLFAGNASGVGNVDGNITLQYEGKLNIGNGSGPLLVIGDPGGPSGSILTLMASNANNPFAAATPSIISPGDIAIVAQGAGRHTNCVPDGIDTGCGNTRGNQTYDYQASRTLKTHIALGPNSGILWGASNATAASATLSLIAGGFGNACSGPYCAIPGGQNATDRGRYGFFGYSSGNFGNKGGNQWAIGVQRASGTSGTTVLTPTADGNAASTTNCFNLTGGETIAFRISIAGNNLDTAGHWSTYFINVGIHSEPNGTMDFAAGTPEALGPDAPTVTFSANGTEGCLTAKITPPSADHWVYTERRDAAEAGH